MILFGFMGNRWVCAKLERQGYYHVMQVAAASKAGALAKYQQTSNINLDKPNAATAATSTKASVHTPSGFNIASSEPSFGSPNSATPPKTTANHSLRLISDMQSNIETRKVNEVITTVPASRGRSDINEEEIYEQIVNEIESGNIRKGLWAKLLVEADGNEEKVRLLYIQIRFSEISYTYNLNGKQKNTDDALMANYNITLNNGIYFYKNLRFDALSDAVIAAKQQNKRS
jgi:hypothetical protein